MQLLIAYALDRDPGEHEIKERLTRVERHYERLWRVPVARRGRDAGEIGLHTWDAAESPWRWPVWQEGDDLLAATLYHPLGYERVVGERPAEESAVPLARALLDRPDRVFELTPPFVIGALEPRARRLTLITDALGIGRLYELRFPGGWVWSNRPAATCLFAGVRAAASTLGWRLFAATGWFMGDSTPFERVYAVPGGTQVRYEAGGRGRVEQRLNVLGALAGNRRDDVLSDDRIDEIAAALRGLARSIARMWPKGIVADLSGGRDSRVVAAALLSAGVEVQLRTNAAEAGEGAVAEQLVAALPRGVAHRVERPRAIMREPDQDGPGAVRRALQWHRCQEGLRPSTYLPQQPPDGFRHLDYIAVGGAAGEIAHGHYYPDDFERIGSLPYDTRVDAVVGSLIPRIVRRASRSGAALDAAEWQVRRVLHQGMLDGLDDARLFDYFYASERLRRWGTTAERNGVISPLLVPEFVRAAFDLTPEQRKENALHRAVTARLVPAWADIPYYRRPPGEVSPALRPRLGLEPDRDLLAGIVAHPELWRDGYQVSSVQRAWELLLTGAGGPGHEQILQQVIWRAAFEDYLAELNGEEPVLDRLGAGAADPAVAVPRRRTLTRGRRFAARALRKAASTIDPAGEEVTRGAHRRGA